MKTLYGTVEALMKIIELQTKIIDQLFQLLMQHIEASDASEIVDEIRSAALLRAKLEI